MRRKKKKRQESFMQDEQGSVCPREFEMAVRSLRKRKVWARSYFRSRSRAVTVVIS
jgi:hypothetical protein